MLLVGSALVQTEGIKKTAQGRNRTYEGRSPPDLQSGAFDRSATCAKGIESYRAWVILACFRR